MFKRIASVTIALIMILSVMIVSTVSVGAGILPKDPDGPLDPAEGHADKTQVTLVIRFVDSVTGTQLSPNNVIQDSFIIKSMLNGTVDASYPVTMSGNTVHVSDDILYFEIEATLRTTFEFDGYESSVKYYNGEYRGSETVDEFLANQEYVYNNLQSTNRTCILTVTVSRECGNYDESEITQSGNTGSSIVTLDYNTANLRVTVPTVLPVSVDSDNNVTVANNAKIINNSNGQVDVTNAVLSGNNSWKLAEFDTDFKKVPVDTKQYGFKLQGYNVPVSGNAYNNQFGTIAGNASLDLSYDANVAIQSEATKDAEIGNIVFTVAWHK